MKSNRSKFEEMFKSYPDIMSVKEVMKALGICKHSVYELIESGQLGSFRIGRTHKVPRCALVAFVKTASQDER